jgi:hypothetical protein
MVLGPDFPKCPVCGKPMKSVELARVPQKSRQEMLRQNWYKWLDPNYWYWCEECGVYLHKLAIGK